MTTDKLKPRWYHLVGMKDGRVFEGRLMFELNGVLFWAGTPFTSTDQPPRVVRTAEVAWAIPIIKAEAFITEDRYHDALADLVGDRTTEITLQKSEP